MTYDILATGKKTLLLLFAAVLLISCGNPYDKSKEKRAEFARKGEGDILVAVVWPRFETPRLLSQGVDLAVQMVNEKGGVLGRKLRAIHFEEINRAETYFDTEKITSNPGIVAVVGHWHSDSTLSALVSYEHHGILLLILGATNPLLMEQEFEYVFRPIPNDQVLAEHLAHYADAKDYRKIVIIDNNTLYGKGLADDFYRKATDLGLHILIHRGYFQWQDNFRALVTQIKEFDIDAIFLGGTLPQAARFIKQLRQMGVNTPVLAGDALYSQDLITIAGEAAKDVVVPTMFRPDLSNTAYRNFLEAYREEYQGDPDQYAALGYDIINLLASVMNSSNTTTPLVLSSILRYTHDWKGVMGNYSFDKDGELLEGKIFFKQVLGGKFIDTEE